MSMYTPSKAVLEFRFAGEKGLGAGVTASFYSAVAAELQRRSCNVKVGDRCCYSWRAFLTSCEPLAKEHSSKSRRILEFYKAYCTRSVGR